MPTARKLPSGSWRVRMFSHTDADGKKHYRSFTAPTKREAEHMALTCVKGHKTPALTFGEAIDNYIDARSSVLSPSSIREYRRIRNNQIPGLVNLRLQAVTQEAIQKEINVLSLRLSPKTVRNIHGLISAVLGVYRPEMRLNTDLPKRQAVEYNIPTDEEIATLIKAVTGTAMELPVLLAAFGPLRRGEICALESSDINGTVVHVCRNMVLDENKHWVYKAPKSFAGDRFIDFPDFVAEKWQGKTGRIVPDLNPDDISHRFEHVLKRAGLPHFRFHDLRHYSASIQHALGVPDAYIMQRGGWSNDGVLKNVYRHAMNDRTKEENKRTNDHFKTLFENV